MSDIITASIDDLSELSGMGDKRVLSIYRAFQQEEHEQEDPDEIRYRYSLLWIISITSLYVNNLT